MRELNARRIERGSFELGFGVALHVGDVMYGNIGTTTRLDFTVIGPAVNVTSRMQTLTKELRRQVLLSAPFAMRCGCGAEFLASLGRLPAAWRRRADRGVRAERGAGMSAPEAEAAAQGARRPAGITLEHQAVDAVIDVGANAGQYATRLRAAGWRGPILSIEPIPELRDALTGRGRRGPALGSGAGDGHRCRRPARWRWRSRPRAT